jgi:hypothetical protein
MARQTINGPQYASQEFNTGDSGERGDSPLSIATKLNAMFTELYAADATEAANIAAGMGLKYADVTITSAQLLALFTTPISILAAPGAGFANVLEGLIAYKAAGTAYGGIDATEDMVVSYTNAAGLAVARVEATGFLDQATAQTRWADAYNAASGASSITPVENAAMVMHMVVGNITTGNSDLKLRLIYRTIPTVL